MRLVDTLVSFPGTGVRCCNKFESSRHRAERGLDILEEPDEDEFPANVLKYPKNVT